MKVTLGELADAKVEFFRKVSCNLPDLLFAADWGDF